jgi:hypothetical protein
MRIWTLFEVVVAATLLLLGLYLLDAGSSNKAASEGQVLIGAVCFALSIMTLVSAVRSIIWHRHMLRHSMRNQDRA